MIIVRKEPKEESRKTTTIKRQVHGVGVRGHKTGRQESEVGKDSGEKDNVSEERMTNVLCHKGS